MGPQIDLFAWFHGGVVALMALTGLLVMLAAALDDYAAIRERNRARRALGLAKLHAHAQDVKHGRAPR